MEKCYVCLREKERHRLVKLASGKVICPACLRKKHIDGCAKMLMSLNVKAMDILRDQSGRLSWGDREISGRRNHIMNVSLPPAVHDALRKAAFDCRVPMNYIVIEALKEKLLEKNEEEK